MRWRIKRDTNDELRQKFVDITVPQADLLGLTVPDPDLKWNEAKGGYDFGEVDWEEFYAVVRGEGPVAKERMAARKGAWDDGAWVREAAAAHEAKRRERGRRRERRLAALGSFRPLQGRAWRIATLAAFMLLTRSSRSATRATPTRGGWKG